MSAPIGPGDIVACIRESEQRPGFLVVGRHYIVSEVIAGPFETCQFGLQLEGVARTNRAGFADFLFRRVDPPSESLFLERLMDTPASPELEPA